MSTNIYAGPAKLYRASTLLMPETGLVKYGIAQAVEEVFAAQFGRQASTLGNSEGRISYTPFDSWGLLSTYFPAYLGVTVGATAAALLIGQRPFNLLTAGVPAADVPCTIWNPAQTNKIVVARTAFIKHPDLRLGTGQALYGPVELGALPSTSGNVVTSIGTSAAFHTITEAGAADPGGTFAVSDFIREPWTGAWGTFAGFGGDGGAAMWAEDGWTITNAIKYSPLPVQKQVWHYKLDSVQFMVKGRLTGPTWTQIEANVMTGRLLGSRWGNPGAQGSAVDLVLTAAISGKTITLKNCDVQGEGYEFNGTKLGTGEIGFINQMSFTTGAPTALLVFSA